MPSTELGHHVKRVYVSMDGVLVVPSSASVKIEAGGLLCQKPSTNGYTGAYATQVANTFPNRGVSVLRTTDITGVDVLSQPTKDTIGAIKTIVIDTTAKRAIRLATVAGSRDVRCGTSSCSVIITSSALAAWGGHKLGNLNPVITLLAASTNRWIITSLFPLTSTPAKYWTFSSTT